MNGYKRINSILASALQSNSDLHILGESIDLSPDTKGLLGTFPDQVHLLPIADNAMLGIAIGMAFSGKNVVLCVTSPQSLWSLLPQLGQEISNVGKEFPLSITIRVPIAPNDSIDLRSLYGISGIQMAAASSATEAVMMVQASLQSKQPTILLEDRMLLMEQADTTTNHNFQSATILRKGEDSTLIAWGNNVNKALQVADSLSKEGISVEVIDLRMLHPLDKETLAQSIQKTGRPIIVNGPSMIIDTIVKGAFWRLENQPQNISAHSEAMKEAIFESLRY